MKKQELKQIISGSLLIAGTTVGAGMLGIPLLTAKAGFLPAIFITIVAWAIMLWTGLLYLEATLWMPEGSNLLSMSKRFLGNKGRLFSGGMFLFLYYCLLVAYFAAGAPLFTFALSNGLGIELSGISGYALFGLIFALIVAMGVKWIDRINIILTTGLVLSYFLLIGIGSPEVDAEKMQFSHWPTALIAMPVLFSAFGYQNIIPSLCAYFEKKKRPLRLSIFIGTAIPLVIYIFWQWLAIGIIPQDKIAAALKEGLPVTAAMQNITGNPWIFRIGQTFAFFAIVTSLLGVSFSMIDFLGDGLKLKKTRVNRVFLTLLTFVPPFILVSLNPQIFDKALGIAGGFGEAILNGFIPIALVWIGHYRQGLKVTNSWISAKPLLIFIALIIFLVMGIEYYNLAYAVS